MMKMKIFKKIFVLLILGIVLFASSSCDIFREMEEYRVARRSSLYEQINMIEKNPNYALISINGYFTATEQIYFKTLIEERIKSDGNDIEVTKYSLHRYEEDIIGFMYQYKVQNKFLGINDKNNFYAIGTISLADYSISIKYFKSKYEKFSSFSLSNTHYTFKGMDTDKEIKEDEYDFRFVTIAIAKDEIKEWENENDALEFTGESSKLYFNPNLYIENGIEYEIGYSNLKQIDNDDWIEAPTQYDVKEKSEEMKQIAEILGSDFSGIKGTFFTNGNELFIGFYAETGMFGIESHMTFPVIFKCDVSSQKYEYIGCFDLEHVNFRAVEVRKI